MMLHTFVNALMRSGTRYNLAYRSALDLSIVWYDMICTIQ